MHTPRLGARDDATKDDEGEEGEEGDEEAEEDKREEDEGEEAPANARALSPSARTAISRALALVLVARPPLMQNFEGLGDGIRSWLSARSKKLRGSSGGADRG
jgi:hypothetical protein